MVSYLNATISSSILPQIIGFEHASDIWYHLENQCASHLRSHIHSKEGTMVSYLDFIKSCADIFLLLGSLVSDEDLILYTINGLTSEYSSLKTSLKTNTHSISLGELHAMLR